MRKNSFLFVVMLSTALSLGFASCDNDNGNDPNDPTTGNDSGKENDPTAVPPTCTDYVDLGLSVKWATCNVGASSPEEYGDYFAWGEVEPKTEYLFSNYKWYLASEKGIKRVIKYNTSPYMGSVDNKMVLDPEDDAATVNMGKDWRMPTVEELKELVQGCTWEFTENYNGKHVIGWIGTSKVNNKSLFLPLAGVDNQDGYVMAGEIGLYWSSSLSRLRDEDFDFTTSHCLLLNESEVYDGFNLEEDGNSAYANFRYHGQTIRGVRE